MLDHLPHFGCESAVGALSAAAASSAGQRRAVSCTEHTCVNWDVWLSKRAEAFEEALIQLEAVVVGSCGNAEHHHAKANGALLIVLGLWKSHTKRHVTVSMHTPYIFPWFHQYITVYTLPD